MSVKDRQILSQQIEEAMERINALIAPLTEDLFVLKRDILKLDKIESDMCAVKAALKATNEDIREIQADLSVIKADAMNMKMDLNEVHTDRFSGSTPPNESQPRLRFFKSQTL